LAASLPILAIYLVMLISPSQSYEPKDYVALVLSQQGDGVAQGSAILVASANGSTSSFHLLTAKHVVAGNKVGDKVYLNFKQLNDGEGLECIAKIVWFSPTEISVQNPISFTEDIAVLEIENVQILPKNFIGLPIGNSDNVKVASDATSYGYRQFQAGDPELTVASCKISNLEPSLNGVKCPSLFRVDGNILPGLSGGPLVLLDKEGANAEIIGINVATYAEGENKGYSYVLKVKNAEQFMISKGFTKLKN
jgi:S1-C subfamily serine protease